MVSLGQQITPIDLSQYEQGGVAPFTYSIVSQTLPGAIACTLSGSILQSDFAYLSGTNTITLKVLDSNMASAQTTVTLTVNVPTVKYRAYGIDVSLYGPGQDPNKGSVLTTDQITQRLGIIAPYFMWVRTFGATSGNELIGGIAHKFGLKVCMGAWISADASANANEMSNLIAQAQNGNVDCAIVGSEALLRNDVTAAQLIAYIQQFRAAVPSVPVATADIYSVLLNNPDVAAACDTLYVNYYPYWEGTAEGTAVASLNAEDLLVRRTYPTKEVVVSETGWPSSGNAVGNAVPSLTNAASYFLNLESWAQAGNRKTFYFEAFDEAWKAAYEGPQGAFWGIWDQNGVMKYGNDVFAGNTVPDNWTCAAPPGGPGSPTIQLTYVPPVGSTSFLQGQVWHVTPANYYIVVYIHVGSLGWWVKPYLNSPLTSINCDGTWTANITTGGGDALADEIAVYLIPTTYNPPLLTGAQTLPAELAANAAASALANR
jgi:exo-beta-1,3-glucanase (GH17 family)